jgi:hypothetical protein
VDKAQQEKQSAIVRAQGEAQSAELIGKAIKDNPSFITLRKIEVRGVGCCGGCFGVCVVLVGSAAGWLLICASAT